MNSVRRPYAGAKELESRLMSGDPEIATTSKTAGRGAVAPVAPRHPLEPAEAYEVGYFAQKHHLGRAKAIDILMRAGQSRERADQMAARVRGAVW
jgi:hypothetical protein